MTSELEIKNLHASIDGNEILKGVNLKIRQGEVHAIMGPNGSGKSTLAHVLMGHPRYKVEKGEIEFDGKNILDLTSDKRAKLGLFLAFQYPVEISGVSLFNFLRSAYNSVNDKSRKNSISVLDFHKMLKERLKLLKMDDSFIQRHLNEGFSGGEKKKCEIVQLAVLQPRIAVLDETDSGTDIDALKIISDGINKISKKQKTGILLITHYNRILRYIKPDFVHVMISGKIVRSGKKELADSVEEKGYSWLGG